MNPILQANLAGIFAHTQELRDAKKARFNEFSSFKHAKESEAIVRLIFENGGSMYNKNIYKKLNLCYSPSHILRQFIREGLIVKEMLTYTLILFKIADDVTLEDFGLEQV